MDEQQAEDLGTQVSHVLLRVMAGEPGKEWTYFLFVGHSQDKTDEQFCVGAMPGYTEFFSDEHSGTMTLWRPLEATLDYFQDILRRRKIFAIHKFGAMMPHEDQRKLDEFCERLVAGINQRKMGATQPDPQWTW